MYMSGKHGTIEAIFLKLPAAARIPAVYIALCKVGKVRKTAIENRLSAMKLFAGTNAGRAAAAAVEAEEEEAPKPSPPRVAKPDRAVATTGVADPAAKVEPKKKRTWEEDFEEALEADEENEKAEKAKKEAAAAAKKSDDDDEEEDD